MSAKKHRSGVTWLCQQRESENKHSTCYTKWDNSETTWSASSLDSSSRQKFLQIKRLMSEVAWLSWSSQKYLVAANYPWHGKVSEESLCRHRWLWPWNWRYNSSWAYRTKILNRFDLPVPIGFQHELIFIKHIKCWWCKLLTTGLLL